MRTNIRIALASLALISATAVQAAEPAKPAAEAAAATKAKYNTAETEIGTLLDDPAAKAIIEKHIPGMTTNDQIDMARAMTLKDVQQYAADTVTDKVLAAIDADFAKLAPKK